MKRASLFALVALATQGFASPLLAPRQEVGASSRPAFVNEDGSVDFAALLSAAQVNPLEEIPSLPTNQSVAVDPNAALQQSVQAAKSQISNTTSAATDGTSQRRKRDDSSTYTQNGYTYGPNGCGTQIKTTTTDPRVPQNLSPSDFTSNPTLAGMANGAVLPNGFSGAYSNLDAVYTSQPGVASYVGMQTLGTYDPNACAAACQQQSMCSAFNIYFERDPSIDCQDPAIDPSYASQYHPNYAACDNPPSNTNIVCTFWSSPISRAGATNDGQYRGSTFQVKEAGSNGYNLAKPAPVFNGVSAPETYSGNLDNRIGAPVLLSVSVDASQGASAATCEQLATTQYQGKAQSFSSFTINKYAPDADKNDASQGVYQGVGCLIYSASGFSGSSFNDYGQYDGQGNYYSVNPVYYYTIGSP